MQHKQMSSSNAVLEYIKISLPVMNFSNLEGLYTVSSIYFLFLYFKLA